MKVERISWEKIGEDDLRELCLLWQRVWQEDDFDLEKNLVDRLTIKGPAMFAHVIRIEGKIVAVARTFERVVRAVETGNEIRLMALASVCSDPELRGKGYGIAVTRDALSRVDSGEFELSLYQTGIPDYYEKLGAMVVENKFVNSRSEEDPDTNPWWNDFTIVYPATAKWPKGPVDLQGTGY